MSSARPWPIGQKRTINSLSCVLGDSAPLWAVLYLAFAAPDWPPKALFIFHRRTLTFNTTGLQYARRHRGDLGRGPAKRRRDRGGKSIIKKLKKIAEGTRTRNISFGSWRIGKPDISRGKRTASGEGRSARDGRQRTYRPL